MIGPVIILRLAVGVLVLIALFRVLRRSEKPGVLILKITGTVLLLWGTLYLFKKVFASAPGDILAGFAPAFGLAVGLAVVGLILTMMWGRDLITLIVRPVTNSMTGEGQEAEPKPAYDIAIANRKKGRYAEAITEIQKQLEMFPADPKGLFMLAEIQAADLKDLPAGDRILEEMIDAPDALPVNVVAALNQMADWRLSIAKDLDGARIALERIRSLYPNSHAAFTAGQRLAHLTHPETVIERHAPKTVPYVEHPRPARVGEVVVARPKVTGPEEETAQLVRHLSEYPDDMEARERLATLYAEHYKRLELARAELEQLIKMKRAPQRKVVAWLNRLADFEIALAGDEVAARRELQKIIDANPKSAAAQQARVRMNVLGREMKARSKSV